ncbi:MAG TPA: hypothetical protein VLH10_27810 [Yinghuangia sp.]|nr:hypothetical protein [Yinghuangia sp.]
MSPLSGRRFSPAEDLSALVRQARAWDHAPTPTEPAPATPPTRSASAAAQVPVAWPTGRVWRRNWRTRPA